MIMVSAKEEVQRWEQLKNERSGFDRLAQDVADFCMPERRINSKTSQGKQHNRTLYDDTGVRSLFLLASAEHQSMVGQSTDWFSLKPYLPEDDTHENKLLLEKTDRVFKDHLQRSNFYSSMMEYLLDKDCFGTGYVYIESYFDRLRNRYLLNYKCLPWEQCYIDHNERQYIDTLYRFYEETARNIKNRYPRFAPDFIQKAAQKEPNKKFNLIEVIRAKDSSEKDMTTNPNHRFIHAVILLDKQNSDKTGFLNVQEIKRGENVSQKTSGFHEFPFAATRFKRFPGEKYGRSPAMDALPAMAMVNKTKEFALKGAEISILPPGWYQSGIIAGNELEIRPGVYQPCRDVDQVRESVSQSRQDIAQLIIRDMQADIERHFFVDQIQFPPIGDSTPASATEISARVTFMNRIIEPVFGRLVSEGLDVIIDRSLAELSRIPVRYGGIEDLDTSRIRPEYKGPLARNQRFEESISIDEMLEYSARARPTVPEIDDVFNIAAAIRERSIIRGVPAKVLYSPEKEKDRREQRIEAEQAQRQLEMMHIEADAASKVAPAIQGGGNGRV